MVFMLEHLIQLIILFFVIFDPFASSVVFLSATKKMKFLEKRRIAILAIIIAAVLSYAFLIFGESILTLFNTSLNDFRVAGGVILGILGVKMALGQSLTDTSKLKGSSAKALASIIATPLLTGPAAITAIIITSSDYGLFLTGLSVGIVLLIALALLLVSSWFVKRAGETSIQVISTIMGMITLAWGIMFIKAGLGL